LGASCLGYLGTAIAGGGRTAAARQALEEGLATAGVLADHRCVGWMLIALSRIARSDGDTEYARARVTEALAVQQGLGDVWGIGNALCETAALALDDGSADDDAVRALLDKSLSLAVSVHDRPSVAAALHQLARLAAVPRPVRAAQLLGCAGGLDRALNDPVAGSRTTEHWITALRDGLGAAFVDARARGAAMTLHEAVDYALEQGSGAAVPSRT
jgi:hypothetical protein